MMEKYSDEWKIKTHENIKFPATLTFYLMAHRENGFSLSIGFPETKANDPWNISWKKIAPAIFLDGTRSFVIDVKRFNNIEEFINYNMDLDEEYDFILNKEAE